MDTFWKTTLWQQFGASIDMLKNAILACPADTWDDLDKKPEFWRRTWQLQLTGGEPTTPGHRHTMKT